eukprot:750205-Hanusia_phi.AAC.2
MFKNNTNAQGCALKESSSQSSTLPSSPSTSESDFQGVKRKADSQNPEGATCKRSKQDDGERKDVSTSVLLTHARLTADSQALGGPGGASFMRLLEQLEKDGIVKRHFGDVPKRLGGKRAELLVTNITFRLQVFAGGPYLMIRWTNGRREGKPGSWKAKKERPTNQTHYSKSCAAWDSSPPR